MIAIGAACAMIIGFRRAKSRGMSPDIVMNLGLIVLVAGFLGAKLLFCIVELPALLRDPLSVLSNSGFVVYGGIIAGILSALIYCRKKKVSFLQYFDLIIPSVAVAQGFGRIGCFLAGCCYGCQTDLPIGIVFQHSDIAPNGIPLFPTQLFSSAGDFLIALILILYARKSRSTGKVAGLYLILYSIGRFIIEFFRSDERGSVGTLSTSQFIAFFMLAGGLLLIFWDRLPFLHRELVDTKEPLKKP
jgi:phosphatidylglycerol:prolipoprotein diacylglycerol transferase